MQELKGLWIPAEILLNEDLSDKEKIILSMILYLSEKEKVVLQVISILQTLLMLLMREYPKL